MKFKSVNWIAMVAWAGGVAIANLAPGIPPINGLLGTAVIYVVVTKLMPQQATSMSKLKGKGEMVNDY
jgi:cytosine permease